MGTGAVVIEYFTEAGESTSTMAGVHGYWLEDLMPPHVNHSSGLLKYPHITAAGFFPRASDTRKSNDGSWSAFYELALEAIHQHFFHFLLVTKTKLHTPRVGTTQGHKYQEVGITVESWRPTIVIVALVVVGRINKITTHKLINLVPDA